MYQLDASGQPSSVQIQAVTFDMDGLMFNTEDLYDEVISCVLNRQGREYLLEQKLKVMGLPGPKAYEILQADLELSESYEVFQREVDELFFDLLPNKIRKLTGLDELLGVLEQLGIPKAVATSSHRHFARTALGRFSLMERFEFVLCGCDVVQGKPHPEIYLTAAKKLNVAPQNMLALEDSHNGSRAAAAAGAFTVAIPTLHSRDQDFSHVQFVADALDDSRILELLSPSSMSVRRDH